MSRSYKDIFYDNYRSMHTQELYGNVTREGFKKFHPIWQSYFAPHLPSDKAARILDIGCGDGSFVDYLNGTGYRNSQGVDLSPEQIEYGTKLGIPNIAVADLIEFLPAHLSSFDVIVARDVLEHFTHQAAFEMLQSIFASLKPGGKLIIQVPNGQGIFYTSIFWGDFTHELAFTESSIRQAFSNAGFVKTACFPTGPVPHSFKSRVRAILWSYKVAKTRFWKAIETGSPKGIFTANLIAVGEKAPA